MSKRKTTNNNHTPPDPQFLDVLGLVRRIEPDEDCLDELELELLTTCAHWIEEHKMARCFFTRLSNDEEDEVEPQSLFSYLRRKVGDLRSGLHTSMDKGAFYVIGAAQ